MLFNEPRRRVTQQTWVFTNKWPLNLTSTNKTYSVRFMCNEVEYTQIEFKVQIYTAVRYVKASDGKSVSVCKQNSWVQDYYRTITLLEEPSAEVLAFLQEYATLQS